ncbi:MAG: dTMP kinase [Kiloniellales bacterium]|nr:dTMP kinase [Kiloniellales bacterium]
MAGRFITFEGGEGAGKSTHVRLLAEALRTAGLGVVETREPGGSPGAEQIRELLVHGEVARWDPVSEALLHFAARRDHVIRVIALALAAGDWVISDRFADSTMAYQGYGHGLDRAAIERLYALAVGDLAPDLTVILDLPVDEGLRRAEGRRAGGTRYERMDRAFHERLRKGFLAIAEGDPQRCLVVDARAPIEAVQRAVREAVRDRLGAALP